jgi:hypothetical protein
MSSLIPRDMPDFISRTSRRLAVLERRRSYAGPRTVVMAGPPTVGAWEPPCVVWNIAPAVGDPVGWVCTAAGTPGVWRPFAIVE